MNVEETERAIEKLLAELERTTNCIVQELTIESVETTQIQDTSRRYLRSVYIGMSPGPGAGWKSSGGMP